MSLPLSHAPCRLYLLPFQALLLLLGNARYQYLRRSGKLIPETRTQRSEPRETEYREPKTDIFLKSQIRGPPTCWVFLNLSSPTIPGSWM